MIQHRSCLYDTTLCYTYIHNTKCSRHVPCVLEVTAACVCLCPEYDTTLCHRGSRRRLSVCQPYDTTTQLTEGSCHISSVSIKTTVTMVAQTQRNAWEWIIKLSCHTRHNAMQSHCSSVSKTDYINYTAQSADSIFCGNESPSCCTRHISHVTPSSSNTSVSCGID